MSEREVQSSEGEADEKVVQCRRTGESYDPDEHRRCPYCYGSLREVSDGDHGTFCDYDPEKDPISFGFPPDGTRHQTG